MRFFRTHRRLSPSRRKRSSRCSSSGYRCATSITVVCSKKIRKQSVTARTERSRLSEPFQLMTGFSPKKEPGRRKKPSSMPCFSTITSLVVRTTAADSSSF
jgi:hypothetical protein